jgi:hypothetical protein
VRLLFLLACCDQFILCDILPGKCLSEAKDPTKTHDSLIMNRYNSVLYSA